jgi:hypothetical protein
MPQNKLGMILMAMAAVGTSAGCDGTASFDEAGSPTQQAAALEGTNGLAWNGMSYNGLAYNGLSFNGLSWNGLAYNGLAYNGLSFNGLSYNGLSYNGLSDPTVHQFVEYLVECALPEHDSVTYDIAGSTYKFAGSLGLAPEWKTNACGVRCQRWITACMLARLNKTGEHVEVSLRGEHPALATDRDERKTFESREAAYYGNFFAGPDQIFMCLSPDKQNDPRVCGASMSGCPMHVVGSCAQACRGTGQRHGFRDCATATPDRRRNADVYEETITVFLDAK